MIGNNNTRRFNQEAETKDTDILDDGESVERDVVAGAVRDEIQQRGAHFWPHDPATLRDYADNSIVKTFIRTIAKDGSSFNYSITDESGEISREAERFLNKGNTRYSFSESVEAILRDLWEVGNHFIVLLPYENKDGYGAWTQPDPTTMYIQTDDDGNIDNYLHRPPHDSAKIIDAERVVHIKMDVNSGQLYSPSPVADSTEIIEIIDEIQKKEALNLTKGAQSGILTQKDEHPVDPMDSEQWAEFVDYITSKNEGKRHKLSVAKGDFDFIGLDDNYNDLDLQNRYRQFIEVLGANFMVNPSYVGFNFSDTNRATDESQRESYRQRGIKTALRTVSSAINRHMLPQITDEDVKFEWDIKDEDEAEQAKYAEQVGQAVQALDEAGIEAEIENGSINIVGFTQEEQDEEEQKQEEDLTKKQQEFLDNEPADSIGEALDRIENKFDTRTEAIEYVRGVMGGSLSNDTYYNWREEYL